jgi:hypothetical protein
MLECLKFKRSQHISALIVCRQPQPQFVASAKVSRTRNERNAVGQSLADRHRAKEMHGVGTRPVCSQLPSSLRKPPRSAHAVM